MFSKQPAGKVMDGRQVIMAVMAAFGVVFVCAGAVLAVIVGNSPAAIFFLTCGTGLVIVNAFLLIIYRETSRKHRD